MLCCPCQAAQSGAGNLALNNCRRPPLAVLFAQADEGAAAGEGHGSAAANGQMPLAAGPAKTGGTSRKGSVMVASDRKASVLPGKAAILDIDTSLRDEGTALSPRANGHYQPWP